MRIDSVSGFRAQRSVNIAGKSVQNSGTKHTAPVSKAAVLTFTGDGINMHQLASITPENMGLGLPEAYQGGEGTVGYEMIKSMREHDEKIDGRSFMPFWNHDNQKGGFKFLVHRKADYPNGFNALEHGQMPAKLFISAEVGDTLEDVAKHLNLDPSELSYVIQSKPNGTGPNALSKYCILEPTNVKFDIERPSDTVLGEMKKIPFQLFKVSSNNPDYNNIKGEPHYFYYTPELAKASKPYSYDKWGNAPFEAEIINSDGMRGLSKAIHSMMDTDDFGHFKPANVVLHDRIAHPYALYVSNMSAAGDTSVNGIKYHLVEHNPGRNYQGTTPDPFKMLTIAADKSDIETLKGSPYYPLLQKAKANGIFSDALSEQEKRITWAILEPALRPFRDGAGTYNVLKTGLAAAKANPQNISVGTVSYTYGKEMSSPDMYDTAKFLTDDFAELELKNVLNGSMPSSMEFDNPDALFGRDKNNGLYKNRKGFTTFKYDGTNIDEVVKAREKNAKWLSGLIEKAGQKGPEALNKLFFTTGQIDAGNNVVGYISKVKDGDILIMNWGRAVEQKGYPITLKGLLKVLQDKNLTPEQKSKIKLIIGGGIWNKNDPDYIDMMRDYKTITELDEGRYAHNVMIVDGWFSKRLCACAHYTMFTSRREMCGITPLEAKAAGCPSGVTRTGGPADYTTTENGFLTKHAVEENPDKFGLTWENSAEEIDRARVNRASDETAVMYKDMLKEYTQNHDGFVARCKKNLDEKIDWHENNEYNFGKSSNRRYLDDIYGVNEPVASRNFNPLKRVTGAFGEFKEDMQNVIEHSGKSKHLKALMVIAGSIAFISGTYFIIKSRHHAKKFDKAA